VEKGKPFRTHFAAVRPGRLATFTDSTETVVLSVLPLGGT